MERQVSLPDGSAFRWVILVDPTAEEAEAFGQRYQLHPSSVRDFVLHPHLPKFERLPNEQVVLLRAYDEQAKRGDTYQAMTRRMLTIVKGDLLVTVLRREQPYFIQEEAWVLELDRGPIRQEQLLAHLVGAAIRTYSEPLRECEEKLDAVETALFQRKAPPGSLKQVYGIKRRVSVIKRILWRSLAVLDQLKTAYPAEADVLQDIREETDRLHTWAEELFEAAIQLAMLEVGLAGQRTNDVMRVLTVFSAFFLPLTFIAGVYGMNFERMPELKHPYGYPGAWIAMVAVVIGIFVWFRRKGWMK